MKSSILIFILGMATIPCHAQYNYGLVPESTEQYLIDVGNHPDHELINLKTLIPDLELEIRYATENNFLGKKVYVGAFGAFARKPVALALQKIQQELNQQGLGIKIFDAYRPYRATVLLYEFYRDTTYVASPYRGSRHNRGCALDLTLIDLKTKAELKMPTEFDSFRKEAWPSTPIADPIARKNRALLIAVMEKHGFKVNSSEWWHYDFIGWKKYSILDIPFEVLLKK